MRIKERITRWLFPFVVVLILLFPLIGLTSMTAKAADNELDMSSKEETWRYIHIDMKGMPVYLKDFSPLAGKPHPLLSMPDSFDATVIFNFNDVVYEGKSVLVTGIVRVSKFLTGSVFSYHFAFADNVKVNIRESYYNYFNQDKYKNALNSFSITWYKDSVGWKGYSKDSEPTFTNAVTFSSAPKPDGADDPNSPDFELGDNGGLDTAPLYKKFNNWWYSVYEWFKSKLKFPWSYEVFCGISIGVLVLVVVGITVLIIKGKK